MTGARSGWCGLKQLRAWGFCLALVLPLFGCGDAPPDERQQTTEEQLAEIATAQVSTVTRAQVSEVFALGSDFTDLQRDLLQKELVGSVVEWTLQVYEVDFAEGVYNVRTQPVSIKSKEAVNMLSANIYIHPQSEQDHNRLRMMKTNDKIKIRGRIREVWLRTMIVIDPAVLVANAR